MKENRVLYSDIDNTLNQKKMGAEKLSQPINNGLANLPIEWGVNTTRGYLRTKEVLGATPNLPYILLNGGEIRDVDGKALHSFPLTPVEKEALADIVLTNPHLIKLMAVYSDRQNMAEIYSNTAERAASIKTSLPDIVKSASSNPADFAKILTSKTYSMCEIQLLSEIEFPNELNVSSDGIYYVTRAGVNKGSALLTVCEMKGIDPSSLIVAGDAETDQSAFNIGGAYSIAVGNHNLTASAYVSSPDELLSHIFSMLQS